MNYFYYNYKKYIIYIIYTYIQYITYIVPYSSLAIAPLILCFINIDIRQVRGEYFFNN
jgi:hypothetical protein